MTRPKKLGHAIRWIAIGKLNVKNSGKGAYQRPLREKWAQWIADHFDPDKFGVLVVAERSDGTFWVLDGQQRLSACRKMGWGDEQEVPCEIIAEPTPQREAEIFSGRNARLGLRYLDQFVARVAAGESTAVAVAHIVNLCGYQISHLDSDGNLYAVQACEKVYLGRRSREQGKTHPDALRATLETIRAAWGLSKDGVRGPIIQGIGQLFIREDGNIDKANLATKLSTHEGGPTALVGTAKGLRTAHGGVISDALADLVVGVYNKGRRISKLEPWR